ATTVCTDCGPPTDFAANPDRILFERIRGGGSLMMLEPDSGTAVEMVPVSREGQYVFAGRFSPDARWIAFHALVERTSPKRVFVAPVRNGRGLGQAHWLPATDVDAEEADATWSPRASMLYFLSGRDGFRCVWARKFDSARAAFKGDAVPVMHFHSARRSLTMLGERNGMAGLTLTPDRLIIALGELTGNIWLARPARP
ncbi:MAG TPA: hypothetical protein VFL57_02260, partial [Bryobacteraceae bacterium]|nr:hypothetical protein [Bryobacteraceae bacterium]